MESNAQGLTGLEGAAVQTCSGSLQAADSDRLAAFEGHIPVDHVTTNQLVLKASGIPGVFLAFAERKFIAAAQVENIAYVGRRKGVVRMDSKPWNSGCTVANDGTPGVQGVTRVGESLRVAIVGEEIQTIREPFFALGLQTIVVAVSFGCSVAGA